MPLSQALGTVGKPWRALASWLTESSLQSLPRSSRGQLPIRTLDSGVTSSELVTSAVTLFPNQVTSWGPGG